mmetsp:Transcript_23979/g.77913  ORF Transcript_23979/g.77913 Transcript_23979/m.77913 type:complete len:218 (+) Transcript_23979:752-1405(+)
MKRCCPTGRPKTCCGDWSAKRCTKVSSEIHVFFTSVNGTRFFGLSAMRGPSEATPLPFAAATPAGPPASVASLPIRYGSRSFHAFLEWMARNSSVVSVPALMRMDSFPPGWSARYGVASYTRSSTTIQQSPSVSCFSTSAIVYVWSFLVGAGGALPLPFAAGGSSAGGGARGASAPFALGFHAPATLPIHPPSFGPATVGCSNLIRPGPSEWILTRK